MRCPALGNGSPAPNFIELSAPNGTTTVVTLGGELDLFMATAVRSRFDELDGDVDVDVDCAGLTFMDASGIRLLLEVDRRCRANGAKLTVVNPPRCVTRLLSLTRLDGVFDVRSEVSAG